MKTLLKFSFRIVILIVSITILSTCKKDEDPPSGIIIDVDGNAYNTINIGTQVWLKENLKTTKYNDGSSIPQITGNTSWNSLITAGFCWYNNDEATYKATYGALYNWYAVSTSKLCPIGWHVPTDAEWTTLRTLLGGETVAGGKLKETGTSHWLSPNTGATNETGFTALPAGYRDDNGPFSDINFSDTWWSFTELSVSNVFAYYLTSNSSSFFRENTYKKFGYSVRCLKD